MALFRFGGHTMDRYGWSRGLFLGAFCVAGPACTLVMDGDRVQCKTDLDCSSRGPEHAGSVCSDAMCRPDPTWSCLDEPTLDETSSGTVRVSFTVADLLSLKPIAGVRLTLCAKMDASCSLPQGQFESDEAGRLDVELTAGFDGYFLTQGSGIYPTLFFPPNTRKQRAPSTLPVVSTSFFAMMFSGVQASMSADRTVVTAKAVDCLGRPAAGMLLASPQADERTVTYLLEGGMPSRTAAATDQDGAGGFVNIRPGGAIVTSTIAATGRLAGTAGVQAWPGHMTMVLVVPTGG